MTTVSKPKRNPARAEVSDQKKMRAFIILLGTWCEESFRRNLREVACNVSLTIVRSADGRDAASHVSTIRSFNLKEANTHGEDTFSTPQDLLLLGQWITPFAPVANAAVH